jgi:hypothetical protein
MIDVMIIEMAADAQGLGNSETATTNRPRLLTFSRMRKRLLLLLWMTQSRRNDSLGMPAVDMTMAEGEASVGSLEVDDDDAVQTSLDYEDRWRLLWLKPTFLVCAYYRLDTDTNEGRRWLTRMSTGWQGGLTKWQQVEKATKTYAAGCASTNEQYTHAASSF